MSVMLDFVVFDLRERAASVEGRTFSAPTAGYALELAGLVGSFEMARRTSPASADVMVVRPAAPNFCAAATFYVLP